MKKLILTSLVFCLYSTAFAQIIPPVDQWVPGGGKIYYNAGNVGIGLSSPLYPLHVNGDAFISKTMHARVVAGSFIKTDTIGLLSPLGNLTVNGGATFNGKLSSSNYRITALAGAGTREVFVDSSGNIIIAKPTPGTIYPCKTTNTAWRIGGNIIGNNVGAIDVGTCDEKDFAIKAFNTDYIWLKTNGQVGFGNANSAPVAFLDVITTGSMPAFNLANSTGTLFSVADNGSTVINVNSSAVSPFVIANATQNFGGDNRVFEIKPNGAVYSREVFVQVSSFPDYVFKNDYKLMPLSEVEKYYKTNQHLPEVPSEKEVNEKGLNIGDMNIILLKKIEELTLYTVELEKKMKALEEKTNK